MIISIAKWLPVFLALVGFSFGSASAYFWWQSSQKKFVRGPTTITSSGRLVTTTDLEPYIKEVGLLNAKAAIYGGIGVFLSTLSGVLSTWSF